MIDSAVAASTSLHQTRPQPERALRHWIQGQAQYYSARTQLQKRRIHRVERFSLLSLTVGLLATASLVVSWRMLEQLSSWGHWAVLLMGFAPICAALCEAYDERFALRTQTNQYARFAAIFRRAEKFLTRLEAEPKVPLRGQAEFELLRELGREALMESGDWVLLRDRPIVLPKG